MRVRTERGEKQGRLGEDNIRLSLEQVGVVRQKQEIAEVLTVNAGVSVMNASRQGLYRVKYYLTRNKSLAVFVPHQSWKADPGEGMTISMLTALETKAFHDDLRERVRWEGTGKDPHERVQTMNKVKKGESSTKRHIRQANDQERRWTAGIVVCTEEREGRF